MNAAFMDNIFLRMVHLDRELVVLDQIIVVSVEMHSRLRI